MTPSKFIHCMAYILGRPGKSYLPNSFYARYTDLFIFLSHTFPTAHLCYINTGPKQLKAQFAMKVQSQGQVHPVLQRADSPKCGKGKVQPQWSGGTGQDERNMCERVSQRVVWQKLPFRSSPGIFGKCLFFFGLSYTYLQWGEKVALYCLAPITDARLRKFSSSRCIPGGQK